MPALDLRPLTLGEILDRTFSLYRRHFLLFFGISAIPQVFVLAVNLGAILVGFITPGQTQSPAIGMFVMVTLVTIVVTLIAYLFSQGGSVFAVSELYLGRATSIAESLRRVWDDIGFLFGVIVLNGLVIGFATLLLVIPGIYLTCRLLVCVPAALIEKRGPRDSLTRSFDLTRGNAGRAFVILLLSVVLGMAAGMLLTAPFSLAVATTRDPVMLRVWTALLQVGSSIGNVLIQPILLIATSIFYFDLRVRKEAFDLQFMMDPDLSRTPGASGIPSILS